MMKTGPGYQIKKSPFDFLTAYKRPRVFLPLLLSAGVVIVSIIFFALSLGKPSLGVDLILSNQQWQVANIDTSGIAYQAGIREGDRPVEINGFTADLFLEDYKKAGHVNSILIQSLKVIDNQGRVKEVSLSGIEVFKPALVVQIPSFFVCLVFWATGFYVYLKRPRNTAARLLCLCGITMGLVLCANMASQRGLTIANYFEIASTVFGPWLLLHFFLVLPEERSHLRGNPLIYLIYLPAVVTLILLPLIGWENGQPLSGFRNFRFIEAGIGLTSAVVVAFLNYFRSVYFRTRQQMKIVLIGCLAALIPFLVVYLLPQIIWKQNVIPPGYIILFLGFIPISMGYALVTQKLLDIDVIIRRSLVYGLITIVMTVILAAVIFPVVAIQHQVGTPEQILLTLVLGVVAAALFGPVRKGIEYLIDKLIYKDRYDYRQIIQSLSASLNSPKDYNEISRLLVGTAVENLNLTGGCLFVKTQTGHYEVQAAQGALTDDNKQMKLQGIILAEHSKYEFPNSALAINPDVAFMIPLRVGEKKIGFLFIGPKISRQSFSQDDMFLLQGLVSVTAVALRSATLVRDVSLRDTFISIASHELRTPLTAITGFGELLLKRDFPVETRKKWMEYIIDSGKKLTDMVDELLNVSRIQSGKVSMKLEGVDITEIIKNQMTILPENTSKHKLLLDIEPGIPEALADRDKLGQTIRNLLSNAIKYSPGGGNIVISVRSDPKESRIIVSVADQGIGIHPKDQDLLFTTFHRIYRPETQGIRGSGLGLYIAKEWIEAMGGKIWFESELNKGSTFYIAIPINKTRKSQMAGG